MSTRGRAIAAAAALCLAGASAFLSIDRIYHVDEIHYVGYARVLGTHSWNELQPGLDIYLFGPLAWLARRAVRAATLLLQCRLLVLLLFWANLVLLGRLAASRARGLPAWPFYLGAATLAPVWDFGLEIRHENVLLAALLLIWTLGRAGAPRLGSAGAFAAIGFLAGLMQLSAFKGFLYSVPAALILLIFRRLDSTASRWRLAGSIAAGALATIVFAWLVHSAYGTWPLVMPSVAASVRTSLEASSVRARVFPPHSFGLSRLVTQTPLLAAGLVAALLVAVQELRTRGRRALSAESATPELLLALAALAAFLVNPTPFPYNLVLVVPQLFLAASAAAPPIAATIARRPHLVIPVAAAVLAAQLGPFLVQTVRHLGFRNARQVELADTAEAMTDPGRDRVWDGVGLVSTRRSSGYHWFLHSLNMASFRDGTYPSVRTMLTENPPAVIIRSYRTDWLDDADQAFIGSRYVALSDELLALGGTLPAAGAAWTCHHAGRYAVWGAGAARVTIDGRPVERVPLHLAEGPHTVSAEPPAEVTIVWVGPRLEAPPRLGRGDHRLLYPGWY